MTRFDKHGVRTRLMLSCSIIFSFVIGGTFVTPALAAVSASSDAVETIVVTAEKRSQDIQKVGMSISAFSGEQLETANISSAAGLSGLVPSLSINQANNNRNSQIIIRNVGTSGTNAGTEPDVGVFIDGVYIPVAGPIYGELTDISTVEVLRGPQGTLYGRNTPVGAINITTRAPSQTTEGMIDLEYGNYNHMRVKGYFGGGITDTLAGRVSFWTDGNDGYMKNLYTGTRVDKSHQYGARGRLRWTPDSDTTIDLIGYYSYTAAENNSGQQIDPLGVGGIVYGYKPAPTSFAASPFVIAQKAADPGHPYVVPGKWQVNSATDAPDNTTTWGISLEASRNIPWLDATLVNILAYNSYLDDAPNQGPGGLPLAITTNYQREFSRSTTDEVRLVSNGKHFVDYVAGLYFFHNDLDYSATKTILSGANRVFPPAQGGGKLTPGDQSIIDYSQYTNAVAVYGQATVNVTDRLRGIGGLRYSYDHKGSSVGLAVSNVVSGVISPTFLAQNGTGAKQSGRITDRSLTWSLSAQYDLADDIMGYATMSSGFKDGGFNSRSATALPYSFDPETSLNYEIGAKSAWFGHRLVLNVDVFRMLVHGYQQSTLLPTGVGFVINNAGNFRNQGVEMDLMAQPFEELSLNGTLSYVHSKITGGADRLQCDKTYPVAGSNPPPSSGPYTDATKAYCNFNGLTLSNAPKLQWSVSARWEQQWRQSQYYWFLSGTVAARSSTYLYALLDSRSYQSGYALLSGQLGIETEDGKWRVQVWGKNLTNKHYYITATPQTSAAYVSGGGTKPANGYIGWPGDPRTFGINATYKF